MSEFLESTEFKDILVNLDKEKRPNYKMDVEYQNKLAVHAYGATPKDILERNRPREEPETKEYRLDSYEPFTKSRWNESIKVLKKMFNDSLFSITYPDANTQILDGQTLQDYVKNEIPVYGSLIEYLKEEGLKKVVGNPNGYFMVLPGLAESETDYNTPYPVFWKEDKVVWEGSFYLIHKGGTIGKDAYYLYVDEQCIAYLHEDSVGQKHSIIIDLVIDHDFGEVPMWRSGGNYEDGQYKSFFDAALPFWNKAISKASDVDAVEVNFAFPHFWSVEVDCKECEGEGYIHKKDSKYKCETCQGSGKTLNQSPFKYFAVNEEKLADNPAIAPPMGFESPNPDIIEHLDKKVDKLVTQGLEAIKMHVVIGQNQSGKSKEWDRSEMHESIKEVSDWMFNIHYKNIVHFINLWRYKFQLKSNDKLVDQEPIISPPTQFNTLTINDITNEIATSSQSGLNAYYVNALTKEANEKRFGQNEMIRMRLDLICTLDPFPNIRTDDKMVMLSDRSVKREDVIISNNIKSFIEKALDADEDFNNKSYVEQYEVLTQFATEFIDAEQEPIQGGPED